MVDDLDLADNDRMAEARLGVPSRSRLLAAVCFERHEVWLPVEAQEKGLWA